MAVMVVMRRGPGAAWTSGQGWREVVGDAASDGGDRRRHVTFGPERRHHGVGDRREGEALSGMDFQSYHNILCH
jgi:hypothetical protein